MAEVHGRQSGLLAAEFDISTHTTAVTLSASMQTVNTTPIGVSDMEYIAGISSGSISVAGLWEDADAADTWASTSLGSDVVFTASPQGFGTAGNGAWLINALETSYQIRPTATDAVRVTINGTGQRGRAGGKIAHTLSAASVGNTSSIDDTASTANGAVGHLHVTAFTGTDITVKLQDSANDSTWADLITFAQLTGVGSEHATASGTVDRYIRVNVAGTFSAATICVAYARNRY